MEHTLQPPFSQDFHALLPSMPLPFRPNLMRMDSAHSTASIKSNIPGVYANKKISRHLSKTDSSLRHLYKNQIMMNLLEKNKNIVSRFEDEFKNKANHGIVDEIMAEDFVHHLPDPRLPQGRSALMLIGQMITTGFPDVQVQIESIIAEQDRVVTRVRSQATHKGVFFGVAATDREISWTENHMYRLEGDKIAEWWPEVDNLSILMQIGAIPMPG